MKHELNGRGVEIEQSPSTTMFSIATAPAKQSVSETISVLSGRLSSATLLEDRRAAILGLRSFAKEYPASVASGALRSLIGSLSKDGEDVDTVKVVLETLLMLFNPNEDSPEASEEIALWLADEFTQRQENITLLLDFLESNDFYSRLYSLQLLSAILAARTERTEECVFTAPLGISRLVAILDDRREAIRNEAISLLIYLTPTSTDIQKLVAFENAFDRIFKIITFEGSLAEGGRVVEDCLIFLANLLRLNPSNQSLFRETGCIPQLATLLEGAYSSKGDDQEEVAPWAQAQRNRNIYALLAVLRLFLVVGTVGTAQNQNAFYRHRLLDHALQLAFNYAVEIPIKAEALSTCADIIRGNSGLQENFAQLQVPSPLDWAVHGQAEVANGVRKVYVIDALLDMTLVVYAIQAFDIRIAACQCLKAYFFNHAEVRMHFLRRAIEGHTSGADETGNVLTTLLRPPTDASSSDPYRSWFAAVILLHLIFENPDAKALAMGVTEGDEANGEEVVTSIQTITAHLLSSLARGEDDRIIVGYLMLLLCWLFEDLDGVNDFLNEGSNVQGLIQAVVTPSAGPLVQGLCAMLLGVAYEFSTKDSPIPRATIQPILLSRMGRDTYIDKLGKLRSHHLIRDFEVLQQKMETAPGQKFPDVYFDATFVDFFKDNYSRILRAIDRDPGMEISVMTNGVQKGISRELVDALRSQLEDKDRALQEVQVKVASLEQQLGQERADHRRTKEVAAVDLSRAKSNHDSARKQLEAEISELRTVQRQQEEEMHRRIDTTRRAAESELEQFKRRADADQRSKEEELRRQSEDVRKRLQSEADRFQRRAEAEMADLRATISRLEVDLIKANKTKAQELQAARDLAKEQATEQAKALQEAVNEARSLRTSLATVEVRNQKLELQVSEKEEERKIAQGELDDLLMVFGDLEEKVSKYKRQLKALGEEVSEGEDDGDGEEDGDDDDEATDATNDDVD